MLWSSKGVRMFVAVSLALGAHAALAPAGAAGSPQLLRFHGGGYDRAGAIAVDPAGCLGNGCTAFAPVATVGRDVTSFVDGGLARNTAYTYRVQAFTATAASAYSNTASGRTRKR